MKTFPPVLVLFVLFCGASLFAQAPTDHWRRGGLEPMVAQPAGAASILVNPAGIQTKEERHPKNEERKLPGKKTDWIFEVVSADMLLSNDAWKLLMNPAGIIDKFTSALGYLTAMRGGVLNPPNTGEAQSEVQRNIARQISPNLDGGDTLEENRRKAVKIIKGLGQETYAKLKALGGGVRLQELPQDVNDLTADHLKNLSEGSRRFIRLMLKTYKWRPETRDLPQKLAASMARNIAGDIGVDDLFLRQYLRLLELRHVNDTKPLAWGFSLGLEQTAVLRSNVVATFMPLSLTLKEDTFAVKVPVALQVYAAVPLRAAFAHDFGEALPGFTFGLGAKIVPYFGFNQTTLGNFLSNSLDANGKFSLDQQKVYAALGRSFGLNLGVDLGVQYHFGAITPRLGFLHAGLKISDLLGFNVPLSDVAGKLRYAIDFDLGLYADYQVSRAFAVFGGAELIQMRGLFSGGQSPYSSLFEPLDHLRLLAGLALFDNVLRLTLHYYNSNFSPGLLLNVGVFQFHAALNVSTVAKSSAKDSGAWGAEFTIRFRIPHDGNNVRRPYRTYKQLKKNSQKEQDGSLAAEPEPPPEEEEALQEQSSLEPQEKEKTQEKVQEESPRESPTETPRIETATTPAPTSELQGE